MGDSTTIALNLTFFGTLGLAFLMFLGLFLLVILTLVLAGVGRFLVVSVQALFGRLPHHETLPLVRLTGETGPSDASQEADDAAAAAHSPGKPPRAGLLGGALSARGKWSKQNSSPLGQRFRNAVERHPWIAARREPPVLAGDWAAAVADADARAMARARAAVPEIKVTVRELPEPSLPAEQLEAVAPLVESALHRDIPGPEDAPSFTKPPAPAQLSPLDTGSLMSLNGHPKVLRAKLPASNT
ncbi:hypothetical protein [Pseudarthrobacter sulfonivorans]|uniref:hypothetical protein n=1 Tax=Pseudarthrobacter sulfonivorans TaxID=121292 RepID=UPI002106F169|nr:hypothetical protein [Pseudarthrobacter sulfonivorans]